MAEVPQQTSEQIAEASLLWDEYKYRHDLIWRHLIRSTIAVVALITVSYSTSFQGGKHFFIIAAILAVIYTIFCFFVLHSELKIFEKIKERHQKRQNEVYDKIHKRSELESGSKPLGGSFSKKAFAYLVGLLALTIAAIVVLVFELLGHFGG